MVLAATLATPVGLRAAEPTTESRKLAAELPLADIHMHLFKGLTPAELKRRMDRNNIRWAGAVGPVMPGIDPAPFAELLGERYIPMLASEVEMQSKAVPRSLSRRSAAAMAARGLPARRAGAKGELGRDSDGAEAPDSSERSTTTRTKGL